MAVILSWLMLELMGQKLGDPVIWSTFNHYQVYPYLYVVLNCLQNQLVM
jgi:hypothetical protein